MSITTKANNEQSQPSSKDNIFFDFLGHANFRKAVLIASKLVPSDKTIKLFSAENNSLLQESEEETQKKK